MEEYKRAINRMSATCSKQEQCTFDILKKLQRYELTDQEKDKIISYLKTERFIDEKRYTHFFINDHTKIKKWGRKKIEYTLKQKHIPTQIIKSEIELINISQYENSLLKILENKTKTIKYKDNYDKRNKLIRFAASKGYSMDEIFKQLKKLNIDET